MSNRQLIYVVGFLVWVGLIGCQGDSGSPGSETTPRAGVQERLAAGNTTGRPPEGAVQQPAFRAPETLATRQIVYVPAYSHIFFRDKRRTINLTTTLSIHNIDPSHPIRLTAVEYYNSEGDLVRHELEDTKQLNPFASTWYVIEESDLTGGVGANFIVEWESDEPVKPPVIETVMISTAQTQGISFTSQGRILEQE